jgi:hypothetical protein
MHEHFCLDCDYVWTAPKAKECPECGGSDIDVGDEGLFEDGHFEGDMSGLLSDQERGE